MTFPNKCDDCGRFIGKDGKVDVSYDYDSGSWDYNYGYCGRCLKKRNASQKADTK